MASVCIVHLNGARFLLLHSYKVSFDVLLPASNNMIYQEWTLKREQEQTRFFMFTGLFDINRLSKNMFALPKINLSFWQK